MGCCLYLTGLSIIVGYLNQGGVLCIFDRSQYYCWLFKSGFSMSRSSQVSSALGVGPKSLINPKSESYSIV